MKYFKLLAAAFVLAGLMCTAAFAEETTTEADSREVTIIIDNEVLNTDVSSIYEPEKGVTLVPFRAIFEAVGAEVEPEYDEDGHTTAVIATKDDIEVKMVINDTHVTVTKGEKVTTEDMGAAPEIQNKTVIKDGKEITYGYTMIPVRFAAKDFGYTVDWDKETLTVTITKNKESGEDETETSTEDAEPDETEVSTEETTEPETEVSTVINKEYSSDGSINTYTGEVSGSSNNQIPNGHGTMVYGATENTYEGDWVDGKREGKGTYTFANGSVYDGYWANDKRNTQGDEQGTMTWYTEAEGIKVKDYEYRGEWKDDAINGKGTLTYYESDGVTPKDTKKGIWENNKLVEETE
ncbi:MAG: hypothetical protein LUC97_04020 [Clostridiales bacterium]|nr:hypothetical protein [Clostridiales bacterium]